MKKPRSTFSVCLGVFCHVMIMITMVTMVLFAIVYGEKHHKKVDSGDEMPKLNIILNDTTLDYVNEHSKQIEYGGNMLETVWHEKIETYSNVELKGHGNTAWEMEKKSYKIELADKTNLFNLGKSRKWILIANYDDDSMLRNDLGLYISQLVGKSPINGMFVLLTVNEEELGVYYLTKSITIEKNAINLTDPYGILVEYDSAYGEKEDYYYVTKNGGVLTVKDTVADNNKEVAFNSFGTAFDKLEEAAVEHDYDAVSSLIDAESFADYFVISEFTGNPDAYLTSFYMYRNGLNDKIHAGIGWDFDAAFGNKNWGSGDGDFYEPYTIMARRKYAFSGNNIIITRIFYYLIEIPEFYELVCKVYQEKLMNNKSIVMDRVLSMANFIRDEAIKNNNRWGRDSFDDGVDYLEWWVETRFVVFDEIYGGSVKLPVINEKI